MREVPYKFCPEWLPSPVLIHLQHTDLIAALTFSTRRRIARKTASSSPARHANTPNHQNLHVPNGRSMVPRLQLRLVPPQTLQLILQWVLLLMSRCSFVQCVERNSSATNVEKQHWETQLPSTRKRQWRIPEHELSPKEHSLTVFNPTAPPNGTAVSEVQGL